MDPLLASLILFAGLVLVAAAGTALVAIDSTSTPRSLPRVESGTPSYDPAVAAAVFCPRNEARAAVRLGIDRTEAVSALTVLQCEHFGDGPVACDMECLGTPVAA